MALSSGHISLLFSRCPSSGPVIEVNEVTKTSQFELQNLRICALEPLPASARIELITKSNSGSPPGPAGALSRPVRNDVALWELDHLRDYFGHQLS